MYHNVFNMHIIIYYYTITKNTTIKNNFCNIIQIKHEFISTEQVSIPVDNIV